MTHVDVRPLISYVERAQNDACSLRHALTRLGLLLHHAHLDPELVDALAPDLEEALRLHRQVTENVRRLQSRIGSLHLDHAPRGPLPPGALAGDEHATSVWSGQEGPEREMYR